jgi:hypothetical protein
LDRFDAASSTVAALSSAVSNPSGLPNMFVGQDVAFIRSAKRHHPLSQHDQRGGGSAQ